MTLHTFIDSVFDNGRATVAAPKEIDTDEREATAELLVLAERVWRLNQPARLPEFDVPAATWAAEMLYRAAQFQVYRDVNAEFIAAAFQVPPPATDSPAVHYSVDICFRYLPDLNRLVKLAASDDPLLDEIARLLKPWPLSAVGVDAAGAAAWHAVFEQPGLQRMYIDRVITRGDKQRMAEPRVQEAVHIALGAFPQLAPSLAAVIESDKPIDSP